MVDGRFQLSFSADGSSGDGAQARLRKQHTWVSEAGASSAGAALTPSQAGAGAGAGVGTGAGMIQERQQQREAAARKFLQKHGFLVDDLVGDEPELAVQRSRLHILLLHVISILQRCLTAVMFGLFHFRYISITQIGVLIALHAGFIGYLVLVRPYASWLLLLSDVLAYLCELTILGTAVRLQSNPGFTQHQQLATALIVCYFFDVAAMVVPEVLRYLAMGWAWLQARRQRQQQQQQQQSGNIGKGGKGSSSSGANGLAGNPRRQPSRTLTVPAGAGNADGVVVVGKRAGADREAAAAESAAAAALNLSVSGGK
jgi:hypothetical protein